MTHSAIASAAIALFLAASSGQAHTTGPTLERQVGEYTVDIGYDSTTPEIPAGEPIRFDFGLADKDKTLRVDFTTVWVRIAPSSGQGFLFSGYLGLPDFGPANMSYAFANGGAYDLTARFENKDQTLAETTFALAVKGPPRSGDTESPSKLIASGLIALILGTALALYFRRGKAVGPRP